MEERRCVATSRVQVPTSAVPTAALAFMRQTTWVLVCCHRCDHYRVVSTPSFFVRVSPSPSPDPSCWVLGACYRVLAEPTGPGWRFSHGLPVGCRWGPPVPKALSIGWRRPCRNKQAADRARDRQGLRESLLEKDVHVRRLQTASMITSVSVAGSVCIHWSLGPT